MNYITQNIPDWLKNARSESIKLPSPWTITWFFQRGLWEIVYQNTKKIVNNSLGRIIYILRNTCFWNSSASYTETLWCIFARNKMHSIKVKDIKIRIKMFVVAKRVSLRRKRIEPPLPKISWARQTPQPARPVN